MVDEDPPQVPVAGVETLSALGNRLDPDAEPEEVEDEEGIQNLDDEATEGEEEEGGIDDGAKGKRKRKSSSSSTKGKGAKRGRAKKRRRRNVELDERTRISQR